MSHAVVIVALEDVKREAVEKAIAEQMAPFDENGRWFRDGSRWDWYVIGGRWNGYFNGSNVVKVGELNAESMLQKRTEELTQLWQEAQADTSAPTELIYGIKTGESLEAFLKRKGAHWFPAGYAFLRERRWHEGQRMGWFGMSAKTECEVKGPQEKVVRCKTKSARYKDAYIVTWNEDRDAPEDTWATKFYERFIKPLPDDALLVAVDYHV